MRVRVAVTGPADTGPLTVTVTDDGAGIADPAVLLSFGENGWERGPRAPRGRGRDGHAEPRAARLHGLVPAARHRRRPRARVARRASSLRTFSARPGPRSTRTTARPGRTAPPSRSRRPRSPRNADAYPQGHRAPPPGTTRCRSSSRTSWPRRPAARRWNAAPSSTARSMRSAGGGSCSARSRTAGTASASTIPTSTSTASRSPPACPGSSRSPARAGRPAPTSSTAPSWSSCCPRARSLSRPRSSKRCAKPRRLAIYRAMAADPDPRPSFADRKRAHGADIDIAPPPPELRPWRPGLADVDDWREPPRLRHGRPRRAADGVRPGAARGAGPVAGRRARRHRRPAVRARPPAGRLCLVRRDRGHRQHPHRGDRRPPPIRARQVSRAGAHRHARGAACATPGRDPHEPHRPARQRRGTHPRPRHRCRLRRRSLVLGRRRAAAGHRRQRHRAVPAHALLLRCGVLLGLRRRGRRFAGIASATSSSRKPTTSRRDCWSRTTPRGAAQSPMRSRASSSGSSRTTGARRSRCATAR